MSSTPLPRTHSPRQACPRQACPGRPCPGQPLPPDTPLPWTPLPRTVQNFALCFSSLHRALSPSFGFVFPLSEVSRGIAVVLCAFSSLTMSSQRTFGVLWTLCEALRSEHRRSAVPRGRPLQRAALPRKRRTDLLNHGKNSVGLPRCSRASAESIRLSSVGRALRVLKHVHLEYSWFFTLSQPTDGGIRRWRGRGSSRPPLFLNRLESGGDVLWLYSVGGPWTSSVP